MNNFIANDGNNNKNRWNNDNVVDDANHRNILNQTIVDNDDDGIDNEDNNFFSNFSLQHKKKEIVWKLSSSFS